jgi:hypothetical protein
MARLRACCAAHAPVGRAITPATCSLRVPCSMNTSTYSRWSSTVSTTRKSQAMTARLGSEELPPGRPGPPQRETEAGRVQDLPYRGRGDHVPEPGQFTLDPVPLENWTIIVTCGSSDIRQRAHIR